MKNKCFDIKNMPIRVFKKRTKSLIKQIDISECEVSDDYKAWLEVCENLQKNESEFFDWLCINPHSCIPIVEQAKKYKYFECMYPIVGEFLQDDKICENLSVGRMNISFAKSESFEESAIIYVTIKTKLAKKIGLQKLFGTIAYFKAKKQTEYKIKIELQNKLCKMLKQAKAQYIPLCADEAQTYASVWYEIIANKKIPKKGMAAFFEAKCDFLQNDKADKAFEKMAQSNISIYLCKNKICVKVLGDVRLKPSDVAIFDNAVVTAQDFSWVYYHENSGNTFFYERENA